jgi:hypothetical protein
VEIDEMRLFLMTIRSPDCVEIYVMRCEVLDVCYGPTKTFWKPLLGFYDAFLGFLGFLGVVLLLLTNVKGKR